MRKWEWGNYFLLVENIEAVLFPLLKEVNDQINEITFIPQRSPKPPRRSREAARAAWMAPSPPADTITAICSVQRTLKENPATGFGGLMTPTIFSQPDTFADEGRKYCMGPCEEAFLWTSFCRSLLRAVGNTSALISAADLQICGAASPPSCGVRKATFHSTGPWKEVLACQSVRPGFIHSSIYFTIKMK